MAYTVARPKLTFAEKAYLPAILTGLGITIRSLRQDSFGQKENHHAIPGGKMGQAITGALPRCADPCDG